MIHSIAAFACLLIVIASTTTASNRFNEHRITPGKHVFNDYTSPLPHEYIDSKSIPASYSWGNIDGVSYLTKNLNQHIPQYCGSCWAHGAMSAFADRIKIARKAAGVDINLSIQYILNCGASVAGSCYGGDHTATYEFIKGTGFVPYDTCQPYIACSSDSQEGFCGSVDTTCTSINTCRTCSTFTANGGKCSALKFFPNASIAEYGQVSGMDKMQAEIYARGPIACGVNAGPLVDYHGGVYDDSDASTQIDHIISVVGWGVDQASGKTYWIVRNSWGEYWGEKGYFRIAAGQNQLGIESDCAWATPATWTEVNYPCDEDGSNCVVTRTFTDPSKVLQADLAVEA